MTAEPPELSPTGALGSGTVSAPPSARAIVWRLLRYVRPYLGRFLLAGGFAALYAAAFSARLPLLKPVFDEVFWTSVPAAADLRLARLTEIVLWLTGLTLVLGPVGFVRQYLGLWITQRVLIDMQRHLHRHLLALDLGFFLKHQHGDLMSRMSNDLKTVLAALTFLTTELLVQPLLMIGGLAVALYASWQLTLGVLVIVPLMAFGLGWLSKRVRHWARRSLASLGTVMSAFQQTLDGMRIIKAFRRERHEADRFARITQQWFTEAMQSAKFQTISTSGVDFIYNLLIAALVFAGGALVVAKPLGIELTGGELITFIAALVALYDPVRRLTRCVNMFQDAFAGAERLFELLDTEPAIVDAPDALPLVAFRREVAYERVAYAYTPDTPTLTDISFSAPRGSVTAIVGERGAGKSTLLDLLLRFDDPEAGSITIDGHDLRTLKRDDLLDKIAVVTQDTFLFDTTIRENVAYGKPDATDAELAEAAREANILAFIEAQPAGWDTPVGPRGSRLSGGERQSLAIARAMIKRAPILLLDEATSNLDAVSEARVQEALGRLMQDRTVFVIAHRLSTVRHADRILVLDHGRIVERGTHEKLVAAGGRYADLYRTQFAEPR